MKYLLVPVLIFFSAAVNAQNTNWVSYHQHGYNLELPDFFLPVASQDSSKDVFNNTNNKDITLQIESQPMDKIAFNSKYISEIGNNGVTYKLIKDTVYTVSYTNNKTVNYHKSFLTNGIAHTLLVTYPDNNKSGFELMLQRIGRSFK
jgi:hypothetical protein